MGNNAYDEVYAIKYRSLGLCIEAVWAAVDRLTSVENTSMAFLSPDRVSEHGIPVPDNQSSYTKLFQPELLIINWIAHFSESGGHWLRPVVRRNLPRKVQHQDKRTQASGINRWLWPVCHPPLSLLHLTLGLHGLALQLVPGGETKASVVHR